jgi:glycosyltransferase involved in cell wall biosynthesis
MRVILNTLSVSGLRTGVGHYTAELLRCLHAQAGGDTIDYFPGPWLRHAYAGWTLLSRGRPRTGPAPAGPTSPPPVPRLGWLRSRVAGCLRTPGRALMGWSFHALCRLRSYDLYHEPNFIPLPGQTRTVVTLHDLSVVLHPEWHPADRVAFYERHFQRGLDRCVHILAVSEFTRQEIIRHLGLPPERVSRVYNGIRSGLRPLPEVEVELARTRLGLPPRYLLYVGTIEPRKNVLTLLQAYCSLPESFRRVYPLIVAGGWGWRVGAVAQYLENEARHRGVVHLGYVPDGDLPILYNGARALVYPSLYEGFGLPPVEMLACGGAVLASTAGAVAETVGKQAHLVEPLDVDGWRRALWRVCAEDDWWQALRRGAVEAARAYSWERCAAETLQVYRKLCGQAQPLRRAA